MSWPARGLVRRLHAWGGVRPAPAVSVRLEPLAPRHAPAYQALASDARVAATTLVPHPYPPGAAAHHIALAARARARGEAYDFAVVAGVGPRGGAGVVGSCALKYVDRDGGQAEVGYWIGVPYWGRGYARAAVRLAVRFAFEDLGLARVVAEVLESNAASARVVEAVGFEAVGRFETPDGRHRGATSVLYELARPAPHAQAAGGAAPGRRVGTAPGGAAPPYGAAGVTASRASRS